MQDSVKSVNNPSIMAAQNFSRSAGRACEPGHCVLKPPADFYQYSINDDIEAQKKLIGKYKNQKALKKSKFDNNKMKDMLVSAMKLTVGASLCVGAYAYRNSLMQAATSVVSKIKQLLK